MDDTNPLRCGVSLLFEKLVQTAVGRILEAVIVEIEPLVLTFSFACERAVRPADRVPR